MSTYSDISDGIREDLRCYDLQSPNSDSLIHNVHAWSLSNSILKKWSQDPDANAEKRALEKFLYYNTRCKAFRLIPETTQEEQVVNEVRIMLEDMISGAGGLAMEDILSRGALGPGANALVKSYNFYTKLHDSPLSTTNPSLVTTYRRYALATNPVQYYADVVRRRTWGDAVVDGSNLSFVPKTRNIARTICTEPTMNMYYQRGIGIYLEEILERRLGISLAKQPDLNRWLARVGSTTGQYGTLDLASASDSISIELCAAILPPELLRWLMRTRSTHTKVPGMGSVELGMVSSMGNGFTFPLQTLIFATLVCACYKVLGIQRRNNRKVGSSIPEPGNFGVFGDDIIVRNDSYEFVARCLGMFGFDVNTDKSFNVGHFRESCGEDYWQGTDVRGVYLTSLETPAEIYSALNRLTRYSARTGIPLIYTISAIKNLLKKKPIYVPYTEGDTAGIKIPYPDADTVRRHIARRLAATTYDDPQECGIYYRAWVAKPLAYKVEKLPYDSLPNDNGMLHAFLGGYIRNDRITVSPRGDQELRYKVLQRYSVNWGYVPGPDRGRICGRAGAWERTSELYHI